MLMSGRTLFLDIWARVSAPLQWALLFALSQKAEISLINVSLSCISISRNNTWYPSHLKIQCHFYWSPCELIFLRLELICFNSYVSSPREKKIKLLEKDFQPQQGIFFLYPRAQPRPCCSRMLPPLPKIHKNQRRAEKFQFASDIFL